MIVYLDSSAVLRRLLKQGKPLEHWGKWEVAYSSEIMSLETRRVIDRLRLERVLGDLEIAEAHDGLRDIEEELGLIPLTRPILRRAAFPMATVVKTLDAIHLATATLLQERQGQSLVFATHDSKQATAARALGFRCLGV